MKSEDSAFYDKAQDYTFSDWVVPYALGVGAEAEDLEEFHLGGFPDLSSFLNRDHDQVQIDFAVLKELVDKNLSKFGKLLRKEMSGKIFVDLGCGLPQRSVMPRLLAQMFSARSYKGVDLLHVKNEVRENEFSALGSFKTEFIAQDILSFLRKSKLNESAFYFIAGIEPVKDSPEGEKSFDLLTSEFHRVLKPKDILFLGAGTPNMELQKKKFKRIYGDPYQEMFKSNH